MLKSKKWKNSENSLHFSKFEKFGYRECYQEGTSKISISQLNGKYAKIDRNCGRDIKRLAKIILIMTRIQVQNRKFDKVVTFEAVRISTRSKRGFVHLGEVNTQTKLKNQGYNRRASMKLLKFTSLTFWAPRVIQCKSAIRSLW